MTTVQPISNPSLHTIDVKLDVLISEVKELKHCTEDHEQRLRAAEQSSLKSTITLSLLFGGSGLLGLFALIRSFISP